MRLNASAFSLVLRSLLLRLLLLHLLLFLLAISRLNKQIKGLTCFGLEVLIICEEQLEINGCLIKEHTGDGWSELFSICIVDGLVNVVSNKVVSVITLKCFKLGNIHVGKLQEMMLSRWLLLLLHHSLLLSHLLLLWRLLHLLLTWRNSHLLLHVRVLLLLVTTSHLVVVMTTSVVLVVVLVITSTTTSLEVASATTSVISSTSVVSTISVLVSVSTSIVVAIIVILTLGWSIELSLALSSWWTIALTAAVTLRILLLNEVDELGDVIDMLVSNSILSFIFGLPKIDLKGLHLVWEQSSHLIKKLDCLLGLLHTLIENISNLIFWSLVTQFYHLIVFQFDGDNWTCLFEDLLNFVF